MLRTHHRATLLAAALTVMLTLPACGGGEERQQKYLERAEGHLEAGNYDKAKVDIKNVLQINPNNAEAYYLMALVEESEQNWQPMFGNLNKAVELVPTHLEANTKLGQMYIMSGEMEKAKEQAAMVFGLAPDDPGVLGLLAALEFRQGSREQSEKYALQALKADPGSAYALSVLVELYLADRAQELLPLIEQGRSSNPDSVSIRLQKIRALRALEKEEEVITEYQQLIELYPEELGYTGGLADYYVANFRPDEALALLRESIVAQPDKGELKLMLARLLLANEGVDVATAEVEGMLATNPGNFQLRDALGELLLRAEKADRARAVYLAALELNSEGADAQTARARLASLALAEKDNDTAQRWVNEALKIESGNADALTIRARMKLFDGDFKDAIPDLRLVLRSNPESIEAMLLLADAQYKDGAVSLALENYRSVLALQPVNTIALYQGARILLGQQDYDQAAANIEKLLQQQPNSVQALSLLMEVYTRQQRWDDALALTEKLSQNEETRVVADLMAAEITLRQGKPEEAVALAKSVIERNDQLTQAVAIVARGYAALGDTQAAISFVEEFLAKHPEQGKLNAILAQLYVDQQVPDKAVAALREAIDFAPEDIVSYINMTRVLTQQGKPDEIAAVLAQGIAANPSNTLLKTELANAYTQSGQIEKAIALLEEAHLQDKDSQMVTNNLVTLLIDRYPTPENLRRAQEMTLGFENSKAPPLLDTLGWLQYKLGNIPQAISLLKSAQKLGGEGAEYWYHLGMAYYKNGNTELAKEQLAKALAAEGVVFYGKEEAQQVFSTL